MALGVGQDARPAGVCRGYGIRSMPTTMDVLSYFRIAILRVAE